MAPDLHELFMTSKFFRLLRLLAAPNRLDRLSSLAEIRLNHVLTKTQPSPINALTLDEFIAHLRPIYTPLFELLRPAGEAYAAVEWVRARFNETIKRRGWLPIPITYNADKSLALLSYAMTRYLHPQLVIETGVGYGITSALVLLALERNHSGHLISIDLPPLSDPHGASTGIAVPELLAQKRWTRHLGGSRRRLPTIARNSSSVGLFISDSANIYSLQRYECEMLYPRLSIGGAALFNNVSSKLEHLLGSYDNVDVYSIWQEEKYNCRTALIFKDPQMYRRQERF